MLFAIVTTKRVALSIFFPIRLHFPVLCFIFLCFISQDFIFLCCIFSHLFSLLLLLLQLLLLLLRPAAAIVIVFITHFLKCPSGWISNKFHYHKWTTTTYENANHLASGGPTSIKTLVEISLVPPLLEYNPPCPPSLQLSMVYCLVL